jgi:methylated-DNA-[protein]-cysteine S-methyltransferase
VIYSTVLDTPIGPLSLLARGGDLVAAGFTADPTAMYARLAPALRSEPLSADGSAALSAASAALTAYFGGDLDALDGLPVHQPGTPRKERLWAALRTVPAGTTVTYAELAVKAGMPRTAARVAGGACASNLIAPVIPCHRVVSTGGGFGGYYYGIDRKEWLLRHESGRPS